MNSDATQSSCNMSIWSAPFKNYSVCGRRRHLWRRPLWPVSRLPLHHFLSAHNFFSAPAAVSLCSSLHPSQSASQVSAVRLSAPLRHPRPVDRPAKYPVSVLWTFKEYKNDPNVGVSSGNLSQPPMRRVLRHEDGTMLTDSEWKAICQSAIIIARAHLYCLPPPLTLNLPTDRRRRSFTSCIF
jgi:hypothetical protein